VPVLVGAVGFVVGVERVCGGVVTGVAGVEVETVCEGELAMTAVLGVKESDWTVANAARYWRGTKLLSDPCIYLTAVCNSLSTCPR
jgi:hypothetical protein